MAAAAPYAYTKGLHQIGEGSYAYLQPHGEWGLSNSGLIVDGDQSLLVDTQFDLRLTAEMLATMADAAPAARFIDILVNSHADGDHTFGNQLVGSARIVASQATAAEFAKLTPEWLHEIVTMRDGDNAGADYVRDKMGPHLYDFSDIILTPPTETFDRSAHLKVGDKDVFLHNVGPAHTAGDTLVQAVHDRVVYTGDLLFLGVHPMIWDGSLEGWIKACDTILAMDVDHVVSGHGPITDKVGVRTFRDYLTSIRAAIRARYDAGLGVEEAALDLVMGEEFAEWISPERMLGTTNYLYRQFGSRHTIETVLDTFAAFGRYEKAKARQEGSPCTHPRHAH